MRTIMHYGIEYVPGRRPVGDFASYTQAEQYLEDNPPMYPQEHPTIVERLTLIGDWEPALKPRSES
jgi:hypothetical protein